MLSETIEEKIHSPSNRVLAEIIHTAKRQNEYRFNEILSKLAAEACIHKNNCQLKIKGHLCSIQCAE